jgi:hypothetical protein
MLAFTSVYFWDREKRVCVERRFPAYFRFQIGDDALTQDELESFLSKIANEEYVREKVTEYAGVLRSAGGTKAAVLLDELSTNIGSIASNDLGKAAVNLFGVANAFTNSKDDFRGGIPAIWNFWFVLKTILEKLIASARDETLRRAFTEAKSFRGIGFALGVVSQRVGVKNVIFPDALKLRKQTIQRHLCPLPTFKLDSGQDVFGYLRS